MAALRRSEYLAGLLFLFFSLRAAASADGTLSSDADGFFHEPSLFRAFSLLFLSAGRHGFTSIIPSMILRHGTAIAIRLSVFHEQIDDLV